MNLTRQNIAADIEFISGELKNKEFVIPSFFSCAAPGLLVMIAVLAWQCFLAYPVAGTGKMDRIFSYGSVGASFFIGFLLFVSITKLRSKYLSMPTGITSNSHLFKLMKEKAISYMVAWLLLNFAFGVIVKACSLNIMLSSGAQLVSFVIMLFVINLDLGRYDLSLLNAAISSWQKGNTSNETTKPI